MTDIKMRIDKIVEAMESKKAQDIKIYDMQKKTAFYDYSIICTASSTRNADAILTACKDAMDIVKSVEGTNEMEWVLIDGGDIIVNIFTEKARQYYELDDLYGEI